MPLLEMELAREVRGLPTSVLRHTVWVVGEHLGPVSSQVAFHRPSCGVRMTGGCAMLNSLWALDKSPYI